MWRAPCARGGACGTKRRRTAALQNDCGASREGDVEFAKLRSLRLEPPMRSRLSDAADCLGRELRETSTIVYGGGAVGSMGALAAGALAEGGEVIGIIPRFMNDLTWATKTSANCVW